MAFLTLAPVLHTREDIGLVNEVWVWVKEVEGISEILFKKGDGRKETRVCDKPEWRRTEADKLGGTAVWVTAALLLV